MVVQLCARWLDSTVKIFNPCTCLPGTGQLVARVERLGSDGDAVSKAAQLYSKDI